MLASNPSAAQANTPINQDRDDEPKKVSNYLNGLGLKCASNAIFLQISTTRWIAFHPLFFRQKK
ncbi:MAG: hypothetical protein COB29_10200 [Sulfitobacter sp.]|nr:MAG: hypothetical protein COB29_10200 [Sulfitobacter sp.]